MTDQSPLVAMAQMRQEKNMRDWMEYQKFLMQNGGHGIGGGFGSNLYQPDWSQLATPQQNPGAGPGAPMQPQGGFAGPALPNINVNAMSDQYYGKSARIGGGIDMPFAGGQLGVRGNYQVGADEGELPNWSLLGSFRKRF